MPRLMETARALIVLALVFLNFGHVPVAAGADLPTSLEVASYCGAPADPHAPPGDHAAAPCDVCLIGAGFTLPPAPAGLVLCLGTDRVAYAAPAAVGPALLRRRGAQPRAPPVA